MKTLLRLLIGNAATLGCCAGLAVFSPARAASADAIAAQILSGAGVKGGLIVHAGCGDGKLTAALCAGAPYLVHGLDADAKNVDSAREHIRALGLYGKVTVAQWNGKALPYADNLVNLFVAEDAAQPAPAEVMRVLAPNGVAYLKQNGKWNKTVKPRAKEIDEWTHFLHGPDNNAVAKDSLVASPRHLQWFADPMWTRSHDTLSSISAVVSAHGRIFSIVDEGSIAAVALPPKWTLVARDAFNGVLLWKRAIDPWEGHLRGFRSGPTELPRRLVAIGERVFVTLGVGKPVTALDAATGQTVLTFAGTENALEIICHAGVLLTVVGDRIPDNTGGAAMPSSPKQIWSNWPVFEEKPPRKSVLAFNADSGAPLWRKADDETVKLMPTTLAASGTRVFFHNPQKLVALDLKSGKPLWRAERALAENRPSWSAPTLVVSGDVVLCGDRGAGRPPRNAKGPGLLGWIVNSSGGASPPGEVVAYSAADGKKLWSSACKESYNSPPDLLVVDGLVWTGNLVKSAEPGITQGLDLLTGKVARQRPADKEQFKLGMGHHRCYRNKATEKYLVLGRDGTEFIDVATGKGEPNSWVRGSCQYGVMPCNGLLYEPPHSCACHIETKLNGYNALAAQRAASAVQLTEADRLEKGPAYAELAGLKAPASSPQDWPTYRHDAARSGRAAAEITPTPARLWSTPLKAGRLSSPVVAGGKIFVACIDANSVCALDAATGQPAWNFVADARVDSPPTIHEGLVLFGCADGRVYCVRASDGKLAWRYLVAPEDRRIVACGQLESAWPIHGSVLVQDGIVFAAAGRAPDLDGGLQVCRLEAKTGRKLSSTRVTDGALPDVLSCDGASVYMRQMRFDKQGALQETPVPHLFAPAGFLDDSIWHRTYWMFGTKMMNAWGGWMRAGNQVPAGRLMAVGDSAIYCFGLLDQYNNNKHIGLGSVRYRLFACPKTGDLGKVAGGPVSDDEDAPAPAAAAAKAKAKKGKGKAAPAAKTKPQWSEAISLQVRAMLLSGKTLFIAGPPDLLGAGGEASSDDNIYYVRSNKTLLDQTASLAGTKGAMLCAYAAADGKKLSEFPLDALPVFDGLAAAGNRLFLTTQDGQVHCLGAK